VALRRGRRAAEQDLIAAREELEEARRRMDEDRRRLVMTVSHELRTPLTVIQGVVNTLATHWEKLGEAERLDMIDVVAANVASLDASILHFIDVGQLERGETTLHLTEVPLQPLIDGVVAKLAPLLAGYSVRTQVDVETAWTDKDALARILELLLSNAVRFSPLATPIHVRAKPAEDDGVELVVIDRGMGIAPRHLPHVFEPFWRADTGESGVSRGAGLGLTIVKQLAELHGGSVRAVSSRDRGSAFHVLLPGPAN
jgi:signal transduction histidine kinase